MKRTIAVALLLLLALSATFAAGGKEEAKTIKIGAIFAVTGPASFLGAPEAKTAEMLVERVNANGGINGGHR